MEIKIYKDNDAFDISYATIGSSGMDVKAKISDSIVIKPMERKLIPTGLYCELPEGYEIQVRPRSGLALKNGITVLNSPGTIDESYRGEIGIILINLSDKDFVVNNGDKIAQMVLAKVEKATSIVYVKSRSELSETERGSGGFGSTGIR